MTITPYQSVTDKQFRGKEILRLTQQDFNGVPYNGTRTTIAFTNCLFSELVIENEEDIDFEKIIISFFGCYIDSISIENIKTGNLSLYFGNSLVSGRIASNSLENIQVNNSLTTGLFLLGQKSVNISFSKENVFRERWSELIRHAYRGRINQLWEEKHTFYVHDTQHVVFDNNFTLAEWSDLLPAAFSQCPDLADRYQTTPGQQALALNLDVAYEKPVEQTAIRLSNLFLQALSLKGEISGQLSIENSLINNLYIRRLSINGEASFFNIQPLRADNGENKIEIQQSNLDNVWFDNIPFDRYNPVSFYRTKLAKARFSSCSFPKSYLKFTRFQALENVHYPDEKPDSYYKDQYEIFLQLKNALEASGNFYEAQKLQAISSDALRQIQDISGWDKFILWSNAKSNNHGLSIERPLFYFFGFTIVLYISYLLSLGRIFNSSTFDSTLIGYYFSFLDPTHRLDFLVAKEQYNSGSLLLDFVTKIVSSYFIYQFISAFRKYGKK